MLRMFGIILLILQLQQILGSTDDCKCGLAKRKSRIIGGSETEVNEYPWQVALYDFSSPSFQQVCGGSLINNGWVLTAAHCIYPSEFVVSLGSHDLNDDPLSSESLFLYVANIIIHPLYSDAGFPVYDFALLELDIPIDFSFNENIRPICLPMDESETYENFTAITTGWGLNTPSQDNDGTLKEAKLMVKTGEECKQFNHPSLICTGYMGQGEGIGACKGDSGGPLITSGDGDDGVSPGQNYELIGVTSFGISGSCAKPDYPTVFGRTTSVLSWIRDNTEGAISCPRA